MIECLMFFSVRRPTIHTPVDSLFTFTTLVPSPLPGRRVPTIFFGGSRATNILADPVVAEENRDPRRRFAGAARSLTRPRTPGAPLLSFKTDKEKIGRAHV